MENILRDAGRQKRLGRGCLWTSAVAFAWLLLPLGFINHTFDQWFNFFCVVGVFLAMWLASIALLRKWKRVAVSILFGLVAALYVFSVMVSLAFNGMMAVGTEELDSVPLRHSEVVACKWQCQDDSYCFAIVQEMGVFPGLVLTKELHGGMEKDPSIDLTVSGDGEVLAKMRYETKQFNVRPYIYF